MNCSFGHQRWKGLSSVDTDGLVTQNYIESRHERHYTCWRCGKVLRLTDFDLETTEPQGWFWVGPVSLVALAVLAVLVFVCRQVFR